MVEAVEVEYHPVSGIPPEYSEYLTKAEFEKEIPWLLENRDQAWLQANCKNFSEFFQDEKSAAVEEKLKDLAHNPRLCKKEDKPRKLSAWDLGILAGFHSIRVAGAVALTMSS
eukprot:145554-Prorocentrum_minimum.AAC.5